MIDGFHQSESSMIKLKNIFIYELIKAIICFASGFFFFTILSMILYVLLLPIDILSAILLKNRMSNKVFILISISFFCFMTIISILLISNGYREQLRFLLDLDAWRK
jgi:hypothetical protein